MNNSRGKFYKAIGARLMGIKDAQDVSIIKKFDFWNRQFDEGQKQITGFPAVFIEFGNLQWQSIGRHKQQSQLVFTLHVADTTKAGSEYGSLFEDRFLGHLELLDLIQYWLTGFNSNLDAINPEPFFGTISRAGSTHDHYYGDILVHQERFTCLLTDESAMRSYQKVDAGLVVEDELILGL